MENDFSKPALPLDGIPDVSGALIAVRNLATSRRNTGALRTMFGVSTADADRVDPTVAKPIPSGQKPNTNLRLPQPRI